MQLVYYPAIASVVCTLLGASILGFLWGQWKNQTPAKHLTILVQESVVTFSKRIVISMVQVFVYLTGSLWAFSTFFDKPFSWTQILCFGLGGVIMTCSAIVGLYVAPMIMHNVIDRSKTRLLPGLSLLYTHSAGIAFFIVGNVILGLSLCHLVFGPLSTIGYGLGCMFAAFFLRIGGGIFKSAADISADISSKANPDIPKFDRRNPATILDITGDTIGDIVGFGSDILGSFIFSIIACTLFAVSLEQNGLINAEIGTKLQQLPLLIVAGALAVAMISYLVTLIRMRFRWSNFLLENIYFSIVMGGALTWGIIDWLDIQFLPGSVWAKSGDHHTFIPYIVGLIGAIFIGFTAEILTSERFGSAKSIAKYAEYGPIVTMFNGLSVGLKSNGLYLIYMLLITLISFFYSGFYGVAIAALGMLSMTATILTCNVFTPLAANSYKICQLCDHTEAQVKNTKKMDQVGHTTAALGNGFSAGAAALATASLFFSLILLTKLNLSLADLMDLSFFSGLIIGIGLPMVFSGFLLSGLSRTVTQTILEVGRQFKQIPYLLEDKAKPDMILAANHVSGYAMGALTIPGLIMGLFPIALGYIFGIKVVLGIVLGTFLTGLNQGYYWANVGDALNGAKRYLESGHYGGKTSVNYDHIGVADNIGDAFKDLLGPSTNILIKCLCMIALLLMVFLTV